MARYVIGDVQGCFLTLNKLLKEIQFDHKTDGLIFLGDTINRGPNSLEVLRLIKDNPSSMRMVLGNHEIFAIALMLGAITTNKPHTLQPLFAALDKDDLLSFLREQPLYLHEDDALFLHAGILPCQSIKEATDQASEISHILKGEKARRFLERYFLKFPTAYKEDLSHKKLLRLTLNYFTFLRMCESPTSMDLTYNKGLDKAPKRLKPWFLLRNDPETSFYFGHWAALGLFNFNNYYCLDSGCVWGNKLSALRISDKQIFQVSNCET